MCAGVQWRAPFADGQDIQGQAGQAGFWLPTDLSVACRVRAADVGCWLWRWLALLLVPEAAVRDEKGDSTLRQKSQTPSRIRVGRGSVSGRTMPVVVPPPARTAACGADYTVRLRCVSVVVVEYSARRA